MSEINKRYDCFPDCWEYNKPYAFDLFIKKATKTLEATGSLEEMRFENYIFYFFEIEINILGNYGVYEEEFSYDFTYEAEELIMMHQINKQLFPKLI